MAGAIVERVRLEAILQEMVERIAHRFDPQRIILFGSYARGTATPDSDVDLLVIAPVAKDKQRKMSVAISAAIGDLPVAVDVIVVSPEHVKRYGHLVGTILRPALTEGKVLYERPA